MTTDELLKLGGSLVLVVVALIGFLGNKMAKKGDVKMKQLDTLSSDEQNFRKTILDQNNSMLEQNRIANNRIFTLEDEQRKLRDDLDQLKRDLRDAHHDRDSANRKLAERNDLLARIAVTCTCGAVAALMPPPPPNPPPGGTP